MGYTTEFSGAISISPSLSSKKVAQVNSFCEERHGGNTDLHPGMPGSWCDYIVSDDGRFICWNGNEKSYFMEKWLPFLIQKFFAGHKLNGRLEAQGESHSDRWVLEVNNNVVSKKSGRTVYE